MGRQYYLTRVVLGRSAYESLERRPDEVEAAQETRTNAIAATESGGYIPGAENYVQLYDHRGYPENLASRLLSRESRRAQNDVLTSVGVLVVDERTNSLAVPPQFAKKHHSAEKLKIRSIRRENETGLSIAAADLGLFCLASIFLLGLRHRTQAFRFYSGVPFIEILKIEWRHFGPGQFLFGGAPASLTFLALDVLQAYFINSVYIKFTHYIVRKVKSEKHREYARVAMDLGDYIFRAMSFVAIAPLEIFATLQRLDLIPSWPLIPDPMTLIPFTTGSPIQAHGMPGSFGLDSCVHMLASLAFSPLALWWILFYAKTHVDQKLYAYLRIGLPKPDYPDIHSWKGAREDDLDNDAIPGLGSTKDLNGFVDYKPTTLFDELKKDVLPIFEIFRAMLSRWKPKEREEETVEEESDFEEPPLVPTTDISTTSVPADPVAPSNSSGQDTPLHELVPPPPDLLRPSIAEIPSNYLHENQDQNINDNSTDHRTSLSNSPFIPSQSSSAPQELHNPNPQITPTTANPTHSDVIQAPVDIPNRSPQLIPSTVDIEPTPSRNPTTKAEWIQLIPPSHHVTALTAHFADAMACHLSTHLSDLLFLPIEALFVRSVALGFLSTPAAGRSPAAIAIRNQVYPPGAWLGMGLGGGARAMANYAGKLAMCAGLEMGVGYVVWQLGAGVAWWVGPRWFEWGCF